MRNASVIKVSGAVQTAPVGWSEGALEWRRDVGVGADHRVLLVDESRHSRALMERIAARADGVVHHARTPADGLRHATQFSYDAIVVDTTSADEALLPLLEQLAQMQATAGFLLSGEGLHFPAGFSLEGNLLGSLRKPWDEEEFEAALRRCFELSRARAVHRPRPVKRACFDRILFMSSAADVRRMVRMLRPWVASGGLVHVGSLEEGLALLGQQAFDVILTDLCLPDACGLDAVVRIRRHNSLTPIVALTAGEDLALNDQALDAGAQDVLGKNELDAGTLLRSMRHARQRQRAQVHLHHGALHDELTSLAKRTLLHQRIANALARSRRMGNTFAVMYIDLDHFKCINDTHGHDVGDAVLVAVSHRLKAAVREYDTVARLGGDEFAILLDTLDDPAEAETVAQRVLSSLAPPVQITDHELEITASMGISVFPQGGTGAEDLLRSADQAMYCAKRAGRNTYSITPFVDEPTLLSSPEAPPSSARCSSRP